MVDAPAPGPADDDLTTSAAASYMVGVYLAVNAIRDLFLLVEGPDCTYMKTQYVQGNHDWLSTLTSVSGTHRIANTGLHPSQMIDSRERPIVELLRGMASHDDVPAVALTSMPMAFITGADNERLTREVAVATGKPVYHIPGKSLSGDWLDGYAESLMSLAAQIDLSGAAARPRQVAVVGYLYDRNEDDHGANVSELRRMLASVGLEACSIWLAGEGVEALREARFASRVLSLPYGRRAARKLARRLGVPVTDMPLPFGFTATEAFVRQAGELAGEPGRADAFVDQELADAVPRLEWVVSFLFQNRRVGFVGEPGALPGIHDIVSMLGGTLVFAALTNRAAHANALSLDGVDLLVNPRMKTLSRYLQRADRGGAVDLLITNNVGMLGSQGALVEFGFPSYLQHALYDRPFLGFPGTLAFVDSLANALRMHEVQQASWARGGNRMGASEVFR